MKPEARLEPPLVLASGSPRRAAILDMLGLEFRVVPPSVPELRSPREAPDAFAERLSREKAEHVASAEPNAVIVAGDTIVVVDGDVLGKPSDREEAEAMLLRLSGRTHRVASGLALRTPAGTIHSGVSGTSVTFRPLAPNEVAAYVGTGEPMDKAGAYGIQGMGAALVSRVSGDYFGVMGLPVSLLIELLEKAGSPYRFPAGPIARGASPDSA